MHAGCMLLHVRVYVDNIHDGKKWEKTRMQQQSHDAWSSWADAWERPHDDAAQEKKRWRWRQRDLRHVHYLH